MTQLRDMQCVPCRGGDPALSAGEIVELLPQLPDWEPVMEEGVMRLMRVFKFKNYAEAVAFTNKIAALAEAADHHPAIVLEWGRVTVEWWTHVVKGLHQNDFVMAAKTDEAFAG